MRSGDVVASDGDDRAEAARATRRSARRVALWVFLGCLLVQTAWIATLPPYRGTDEIDHAYRAAQVASGEWGVSTTTVPGGRGQLVPVPPTVVRAAQPVCTSYEYMRRDNCYPVRRSGDGRVLVSTSASAYNPVFYATVGWPTRVWDGTTAIYVMRALAALLCAALVAAAAWTLRLWATTAWPLVALLTAATPVITFSLAVAAPNGLEMAACLSLWCALLGCATARGREQHGRALLSVAAVSATVACVPRSLGPFWVLAIALTALVVVGRRPAVALVGAHRRLVAGGAAAVLCAAVASAAWTRAAGTQTLGAFDAGITNRWTGTLEQVPLWLLQGVAAFPRRSDPAPAAVYVLVGAVCLTLLVAGVRRADRRLRWAMAGGAAFALGVPFAFTLTSITFSGPLWQGRYGAPYHLGLFLLAGLALDRHPPAMRLPGAALLAVPLVVGQTWSVLHVLARERSVGPYAGSSAWSGPPAVVVVLLVLAGAASVVAAVRSGHRSRDPVEAAQS